MKSSIRFFIVGLLSTGTIFFLWDDVHSLRDKYIAASISNIAVIPAEALVVGSLEFQGVVADGMFLNASNFIGQKIKDKVNPLPEEWHFFYLMLDRMSSLDGRFLDPYIFAEMMLAWQGQMFDEANMLLSKGRKYRPFDWRLPYYIGFNHFFFLKDYETGADYVMQAANISGSPSAFPNLAARLAFYGERSKTALLFLRQLIAENKQVRLNPELKKRLTALQSASNIEDAALEFFSQYDRRPNSIDELVLTGFLSKIPEDPYGGQWRLHQNGRVDSTSNFLERP